MMNTGNLDILCDILVLAPDRGEAGEVLTDQQPWKVAERMWLGRVKFNGRALPTAQREASLIERVFEGWARFNVVKEGVRLVAEGVTYKVDRVDPAQGRQWMLVYCSVVK